MFVTVAVIGLKKSQFLGLFDYVSAPTSSIGLHSTKRTAGGIIIIMMSCSLEVSRRNNDDDNKI